MSVAKIPSEVAGKLVKGKPTGPAVYFLLSGKEVVYIGAALRVASRICFHRRHNSSAFDLIMFLPCEREQLEETEKSLIKLIRPKHNRRGKERGEWVDDAAWNGSATPTPSGLVDFHVDIDSGLYQALKEYVKQNRTTISEVITQAICKDMGIELPSPRRKRGRPRKAVA